MDIIGIWLAIMLGLGFVLLLIFCFDVGYRIRTIKKEREKYGSRKCK